MAVTPMDLQVLFMQESNAAREAKRLQKHGQEVKSRMARKTAYRSLRESVDAADDVDSKRVDEEGGQGTPNYFARRPYQPEEREQPERERAKEEGKGDRIDLTI